MTRGNGSIHIPVEIFDWEVWPDRRQYYNLEKEDNGVLHISLDERKVPVLNAGWLLRQKLLAYSQRAKKTQLTWKTLPRYEIFLNIN